MTDDDDDYKMDIIQNKECYCIVVISVEERKYPSKQQQQQQRHQLYSSKPSVKKYFGVIFIELYNYFLLLYIYNINNNLCRVSLTTSSLLYTVSIIASYIFLVSIIEFEMFYVLRRLSLLRATAKVTFVIVRRIMFYFRGRVIIKMVDISKERASHVICIRLIILCNIWEFMENVLQFFSFFFAAAAGGGFGSVWLSSTHSHLYIPIM